MVVIITHISLELSQIFRKTFFFVRSRNNSCYLDECIGVLFLLLLLLLFSFCVCVCVCVCVKLLEAVHTFVL